MKPMLAHKFDIKRVDYSEPVYIQPKLDGVRCLFTKDGAFSRTGKQFMNVAHIHAELIPFFQQQPDVVLDGELYNHKLKNDFEKIISLVRKQKPTADDRLEARQLVQFHVYDYFDGVMYDNYEQRMNQLNCVNFYGKSIKYVPSYKVNKHEEALNMHHDGFLADGYEGSILRLNGLYKHGRSYDLMKFKDFSDTEATIIGYETGKGKREGTIGKFLMQDDEGVKFGCPPGKGYNYKDLANILDNIGDYIGKRATFTYFQRTQAGSYRHPLFKCIRNYE
jgi:DNA ligase-1|tara:strand:- start:2438 stop:3271 length:834 start_codon:yes stop_codon:yes gene_type:complete